MKVRNMVILQENYIPGVPLVISLIVKKNKNSF